MTTLTIDILAQLILKYGLQVLKKRKIGIQRLFHLMLIKNRKRLPKAAVVVMRFQWKRQHKTEFLVCYIVYTMCRRL